MTHAVSRHQEFTADTLAARVVGSHPLIEGLKLTYGAAYAFDAYWLNEVAPVLRYGFHPPLAEGFRRYLASPRIAAAISTSLDRELAEGETNPYDTHPPLRARIAAVGNRSDRETPEHDLPAMSLLGGIPRLETQLIKTISDEPPAQASQLVAWDDVGRKIWAPTWEAYAGEYAKVLSGITPRTLPQLARNLDPFSERLRESDGADLAAEERRKQASATLGVALAVALSRNGWELHVFPGEDAVCERNGRLIKPFDIVPQLASGELRAEAWQDFSVVRKSLIWILAERRSCLRKLRPIRERYELPIVDAHLALVTSLSMVHSSSMGDAHHRNDSEITPKTGTAESEFHAARGSESQ